MRPFPNIGRDGSLRNTPTAAGDEVCDSNRRRPKTTPEPIDRVNATSTRCLATDEKYEPHQWQQHHFDAPMSWTSTCLLTFLPLWEG